MHNGPPRNVKYGITFGKSQCAGIVNADFIILWYPLRGVFVPSLLSF